MSSKSIASHDDAQLSLFDIGYIKATAEDEAHEIVLRVFLEEAENDPTVTRAFLAKKTHKKPEQITRLLGSSGNWTIDTYAILLAALGYKACFGATKLSELRWDNTCHKFVSENAPKNPALTKTTYGSQTQTLVISPQSWPSATGYFTATLEPTSEDAA